MKRSVIFSGQAALFFFGGLRRAKMKNVLPMLDMPTLNLQAKIKKAFLFLMAASVFTLIISCASTKVLTPRAIERDIIGLENLANCQFFLSKQVILEYSSDQRQANINERTGVVHAERVIRNERIKIEPTIPGILQTKNKAGEPVQGYSMEDNNTLTLYILFENDNDNYIQFTTLYNDEMHRFELYGNEVNYDGLTYKVSYQGDDRPYLNYRHIERFKDQSKERKASGRRVGS
jgi:uncharacterized protein (UPF0333 family)